MSSQEYVPIEAVADRFAVSVSTVRSWIRKDHIPRNTYIKAGNTYRFVLADIEKALRQEEPKDDIPWQKELALDASDTPDIKALVDDDF
jgi:DNA-binding transcriptional MerR regulator